MAVRFGTPHPHPNPPGIVLQAELESLQKRAARFVTGNYCYETGSMIGILGQLKWESLMKGRKDNRLILLYKGRASVKPTYGVNYVLKSPPYAEIQDQRRPPYFQYSVLYAQNQTPRRPLQWQNPANVSISPAYLWRNCVCACARPLVCRSVIFPIGRVVLDSQLSVSRRCMSDRSVTWRLAASDLWSLLKCGKQIDRLCIGLAPD